MTFVLSLLALVALLAVAGIVLYNALVRARQMTREGWSGIDVQLKRRADLIPNLIETVKGYAAHESATFESVVTARTAAMAVPKADVTGRAQMESVLGQAIGKVIALAEGYPDLKASDTFRNLQTALGAVEEDLQRARRYYNAAARETNIKVESFPSSLVAGQFGFTQHPYFEIDTPEDRAVPKVQF